jgi:hypothetical protein
MADHSHIFGLKASIKTILGRLESTSWVPTWQEPILASMPWSKAGHRRDHLCFRVRGISSSPKWWEYQMKQLRHHFLIK